MPAFFRSGPPRRSPGPLHARVWAAAGILTLTCLLGGGHAFADEAPGSSTRTPRADRGHGAETGQDLPYPLNLPGEGITPDQSEDFAPDQQSAGPDVPNPRPLLPTPPPRSSLRAAPSPCTTTAGSRQRQVESFLGLTSDGRQSPADCKAIQNYQRQQGIRPAQGLAGPITYTSLYARWAAKNPSRLRGCPSSTKRMVCVDLNHQILWVVHGKKLLLKPVPIRSGRPSHPTRTGSFSVYWRHKDHWSSLYNAPMPHAQFFSKGQAFHGIYGNLFQDPGSYGCVNLRYQDAQQLWKTLRSSDQVRIWGRRP
ncbi:L,D-transpeptidase [Streptomyces sp. NPDC004111]|uniref:L,D-transpeptidase n=1 Tax=Streptomyces sp. NPDC004111 TaxID=3364690 RepID=UPI0036826EEE